MPKIKTVTSHVDAYNFQASLNYSTKVGLFYVIVEKITGNFSTHIDHEALLAVFDSLNEDYLKKIRTSAYNACVIGLTEEECERDLKKFMRTFFTSKSKVEKMIVYTLTYQTPHGNNERFNRNVDKRYLEYSWRILEKETYTGDPIYYEPGRGTGSRRRIHGYMGETQEIPWTQEVEDFLTGFDKSFHDLIERMLPFFKEEGKMVELLNIQKALL